MVLLSLYVQNRIGAQQIYSLWYAFDIYICTLHGLVSPYMKYNKKNIPYFGIVIIQYHS